MSSVVLSVGAFFVPLAFQAGFGQEKIIFQQDFESDEVGQHPSGSWFFSEGTGASCLVSDEAGDVPGARPGSRNLKFAKTQTGSGTGLTVHWKFEEYSQEIMTSGRLTATYWVDFASGQLMRHVAFRGSGPYKHYMKTAVRGNWPDDVRLEFPINGPQMVLSGPAWHKLTFSMEWDPVWPLPPGGISRSSVTCRCFVDDEEHPGSPASPLEDLVSPLGSVELNTHNDLPAVCHFDDITVTTAAPRPGIKSLISQDGRLALEWIDPADALGVAFLYQASDPAGPWTLLQGNVEALCLLDPGKERRLFYRVGPEEQPSPERKVIFDEDFESYSSSEEATSMGGWTIGNGSGTPEVTWRLWSTTGDPLGAENPDLVGMSGNYVISDSDFSQDARLDEELISPIIDCTGYSDVRVEFMSNVKVYEEDEETDAQITDLDISVYDADSDAWSEWWNVFTRNGTSGDWSSETPKSFGLGPLADGRKVRLRWRFHDAQYDFWWAIDDVRVTSE